MREQVASQNPIPTSLASVVLVLGIAACSAGSPGPRDLQGGSARPLESPPLVVVESAYVLAGREPLPVVKPAEYPGLHNVFELGGRVISGSEPQGDAAFAQLASMGVKTIVSVDGKEPDWQAAVLHGLRYVHVPIEYRGLDDEEVAKLVKTFRELDGRFYVHCFHGRHRGPAAAAVGRIVLDGAPREVAIAEMRQWCGTAAQYEGLYRGVATLAMPSEAESVAFAFDFPAVHRFEGFRSTMVTVSRRFDALERLVERDWAADPEHADLDAVNEAKMLAEAFEQSLALDDVASRPDDFRAGLGEAAATAADLARLLESSRAGDATALAASQRAFKSLGQSCKDCHSTYRN
jgi:hypothetical protein